MTARVRVRRASCELRRVHRMELARALRRAAEIRLAHAGAAHRLFGARSALRRAGWLALVRDVIHLADLDGFRDPALVGLARWSERDPADWPEPTELATESLLLHDCEEGRVVLARAQLAGGRALAAVGTLAELRRRTAGGARWRVLAAFAGACHAGGAERLALEALDTATALAPCGSGPRCASLALALLAADAPRARAAADGLRSRSATSAWSRGIAGEVDRLARDRGEPRPWSPRDGDTEELVRQWSADAGLLGAACRALAGTLGSAEDAR